MLNRKPFHTADSTRFYHFKGYDSLWNLQRFHKGDAPHRKENLVNDINQDKRITRRRLGQYAIDLPARDLSLLFDLEDCRHLTTGQIARLRFEEDHANPTAALRAANRAVTRLKEMGLVASLDRRIGGVRGGSGGLVWNLTAAGAKLVNLDSDTPPRRRNYEPTARFTDHTLAIAETYIQLLHISGVALTKAEFEPVCWRDYSGSTLKSDLFVITSDGEYEDYWFFEVDLATETPQRIVAKCQQYEEYYLAGEEQKQHGLFPKVVWIAHNNKRCDSIRDHIAKGHELQHKSLFTVIMPDELEALIRKGAGV